MLKVDLSIKRLLVSCIGIITMIISLAASATDQTFTPTEPPQIIIECINNDGGFVGNVVIPQQNTVNNNENNCQPAEKPWKMSLPYANSLCNERYNSSCGFAGCAASRYSCRI